MRGKEYPVFKTPKQNDRDKLEWLVGFALDEGIISISRGRELLGFQFMEQMREWVNRNKEGE